MNTPPYNYNILLKTFKNKISTTQYKKNSQLVSEVVQNLTFLSICYEFLWNQDEIISHIKWSENRLKQLSAIDTNVY